MRTIKLMADYGCFPLWEPSSEEYNVDPNGLPISEELKSALMSWADKYDVILNQEDPASSTFASNVEKKAFEKEGEMLY
jgi:hypothetical protein